MPLSLFSRTPAALPVPGLPGVEVSLRRSARARRLSLRVGRIDGVVTLTIPARLPLREAQAFLAAQAGWVARALEARPQATPIGPGTRLPVEGRLLTLTPLPGRGSPRIDGDRLILPGPADRCAARTQAWLRALARDRLAAACDAHAASLGRRYTALTLRDTRSRWGSCTSTGRLMFNWRLILAPPQVLDYVAAHEVAHLARMDHSPAFWATVASLMPGYAAPRRWLKTEGQTLHAWQFEKT